MELKLTSDQELFRDTTARFLEDTCPLDVVRTLESDSVGFDQDWWARAAELGWTSMLAPEALGGGSISGQGVRDLALVAYERGRLVSPGPLAPVNVVISVLAEMADRPPEIEALLTAMMAGSATATLAIAEPNDRSVSGQFQTRVTVDGDQVILNGIKSPVESAVQAEAHLVVADGGTEPMVLLVPHATPGVTVTPLDSVDLVRRFARLNLEDVTLARSAVVAVGSDAVARCIDLANVLALAETVGALDRVFEFTLEWAFDRYTFGRPLASYQELKHRFADMKLWLEASKATVSAAVLAVAEASPDAAELVSTAKSYVSEHGPELVQDCVQMHGGIGVTWDHDIHLYLRRVTVNSGTYGTVRDHRERLAGRILEGA